MLIMGQIQARHSEKHSHPPGWLDLRAGWKLRALSLLEGRTVVQQENTLAFPHVITQSPLPCVPQLSDTFHEKHTHTHVRCHPTLQAPHSRRRKRP